MKITDCINGEKPYRQSGMLKAIIDTGSYHSFIKRSLVENLGLKPNEETISFQPIGMATETSQTYSIGIFIPEISNENYIEWKVGSFPGNYHSPSGAEVTSVSFF